nr:uncharacterized protein LOC106030399 isoform X1 [Anser cygnoides]
MRYLLHWQGAMELPDLTPRKGSVKLLKERWESASALTPSLAFQRLPAPRSLVPEKTSRGSTVEEALVDSGRADVIKEEPLGSPRQVETFPITVKKLQSRYETLGGRKEAESGRCSLPPALTSQPLSHTDISLMESSVKRGRAIFEKMSSGKGQNINTEVAVGGCKAAGGLPEESPLNTGNMLTDFQENVFLKEKMALYQAAVSKAESSNCFANTSEEIKSCTLPGGLAAVRKQFEKGQMTPARTTFARSEHQHKSAEETSSTTQLSLSSSTREAECSGTASKEGPVEAFQTQEFLRCTETVNLRKSEDKGQKGVGYLDQTIQLAEMRETLHQPKSTTLSAASKIRAINAIIKNHAHSVRRPHHQGAAGLPVPNVVEGENPKCQRGEICSEEVLPKPTEPQMREPLRQPKSKINSAASRIKAINEIHRNQKHSQRHPKQEGAAFLAENVQGFKTTKSDIENKDASFTVSVLCSNAQQV